jgi:hypothetical protein
MKLSKESLKELKDRLPKGSSKMIRDRLLKKGKKKKYSLQYIYRCLDPEKPDYNRLIIKEAILLGEEMTKRIADQEIRVSKLRKTEL